MFGLIHRRLVQALHPLPPMVLAPRTPRHLSPCLMGAQLAQAPVKVGRSWLSDGQPRQESFPPDAPRPSLPKGYIAMVDELSDGITDLELDSKLLLHLSGLLFGLILITFPKIHGMMSDSERGTSSLQVEVKKATEESERIKAQLSSLKVEVAKRSEKMVPKPTTSPSA